MHDLDDLAAHLQADQLSLKTHWIATRQAWRDAVGDRFEREFWQPLETESTRYLDALRQLSDALQEADLHTR